MPDLDPTRLTATIRRITPDERGQAKIVHIDWHLATLGLAEGKPPEKILVLVDQIAVDARATDEEIRRAVQDRRLTIAPTLAHVVPNPEANAALVGEEL